MKVSRLPFVVLILQWKMLFECWVKFRRPAKPTLPYFLSVKSKHWLFAFPFALFPLFFLHFIEYLSPLMVIFVFKGLWLENGRLVFQPTPCRRCDMDTCPWIIYFRQVIFSNDAIAGPVSSCYYLIEGYLCGDITFRVSLWCVVCVFAVVSTVLMYLIWCRHLKLPEPVSVR